MGAKSALKRTPPGEDSQSTTTQGQNATRVSIDTKPLHEQSPLLSPAASDDDEEPDYNQTGLDYDESEYQETKNLWYFVLLTISIGGLQLAWAVEISNGTPYLLSLGLSKSLMALVWIAGPLSGTLVQPYVGMLSDSCRSSWGKRTPFMVFGGLATMISLMALAWVREMVGGFLGLFGADKESDAVKNSIIVVAVLFIYILDFSINTIQASIRTFILDNAPSHQQETANAMASRIVGFGNIIGYVAGYIDLPKYLGFFGNTQFKVLCVIACICLASTLTLSVSTIRERDPRLEGPPPKGKGGLIQFFKKVFKSIKRLPPQTRKVCEVQFFAWIGFFPQLFYSSSYVGDIYVQPYLKENPNMSPADLDKLYEKATRVGTLALLIYAITSLTTNVFLPFFIAPSYDLDLPHDDSQSALSNKSDSAKKSNFLDKIVIPWLTLRRAWMIAHIVFSLCMFSTLFVRSIGAAIALIGVVGISWALTLWAPFAIISAEISKRDTLRRIRIANHETVEEEDQAGVILGIHNMSIAAPQILATVGSSIIFKLFQKPRGTPGDHSISIVLAAGGIFTLIAAFLTSRIEDEVVLAEDHEYQIVEEGAVPGGSDGGPPTLQRRSTERSERPRLSAEGRRSMTLIRSQSYSGGNY